MYVWYSPMTFECSALFENNTLVNENKRTHIFNNLTCITLFSHSSGNSFGNIFVISQQANFLSDSARSRIRLIFTTFSQHFFNIWHVSPYLTFWQLILSKLINNLQIKSLRISYWSLCMQLHSRRVTGASILRIILTSHLTYDSCKHTYLHTDRFVLIFLKYN